MKILFITLFIFFLFFNLGCEKKESPKNKTELPKAYDFDSTFNEFSTSIKNVVRKDTFIFKIHQGLSDFKFILLIDHLNFINEIQVYSSGDSDLIQKITTDSLDVSVQQTPESNQYFFTKDFNFDGYEDLVLLEDCGVTGNQTYGVWLYNKSKKLFETNDFFISIDRPTLDKDEKQITTFINYGGADEYLYKTYKLINNQFVLISEVKYWRDEEEKPYLPMRDSSVRYGNTMKLVSRKIANK